MSEYVNMSSAHRLRQSPSQVTNQSLSRTKAEQFYTFGVMRVHEHERVWRVATEFTCTKKKEW